MIYNISLFTGAFHGHEIPWTKSYRCRSSRHDQWSRRRWFRSYWVPGILCKQNSNSKLFDNFLRSILEVFSWVNLLHTKSKVPFNWNARGYRPKIHVYLIVLNFRGFFPAVFGCSFLDSALLFWFLSKLYGFLASNLKLFFWRDLSKSLKVSPANPFDWKFLKICSVRVHVFVKRFPNIQVFSMSARPCPFHSSDYQGCLVNKQELVWVNCSCVRVVL